MDRTDSLSLMHAVLDGAASAGERAALDRLLAEDAGARAEYEQLGRLFAGLAAMPREVPPAGFADQVVAALNRGPEGRAGSHQPFAKSGVIVPTGSDIKVRAPSKPVITRTPSEPIWGSQHMSKKSLWIVGGVAAAVMALFVGTAVDFPPKGDNATGTIAPAERYRAAQPNEVKLNDGTTGTASTSPIPTPQVGNASGPGNAGGNLSGPGNAGGNLSGPGNAGR